METVVLARDVHPIAQFVRGLGGDLMLIREVAHYLGVSQAALRGAAQRHPELGPSYSVPYKRIRLNLYTPQDMLALERYLTRYKATGGKRRGQPRLWTEREARERIRRRDRARHLVYRSRREAAAGREDLAARSRIQAARLRQQLNAEHEARAAKVFSSRRPE